MGEVYRGRDTRLERSIALKVLPSHLSATPELRARFEREARTISLRSYEPLSFGRERDTVWAVRPAFASDDTLALPEQTLLYHGAFGVVNGVAFKAVFQGAWSISRRSTVSWSRSSSPSRTMRPPSGPSHAGTGPRSRRRAAGPGRIALIVIVAGLAGGCSGSQTPPTTVQVGHHPLRLVTPRGWEHLDHGHEQLFRNGEAALRLTDLGVGAREGLANELREARSLWLAGRKRDAFTLVSTLHRPPVRFLEFWRPWADVTFIPGASDSAAVGRALETLIHQAEDLPEAPVEIITVHVMRYLHNADLHEVTRRDSLVIHGSRWLVIETWDRLSHLQRRRVGILENRGYLLTLTTERGAFEQTIGAFDSLLASIELAPEP